MEGFQVNYQKEWNTIQLTIRECSNIDFDNLRNAVVDATDAATVKSSNISLLVDLSDLSCALEARSVVKKCFEEIDSIDRVAYIISGLERDERRRLKKSIAKEENEKAFESLDDAVDWHLEGFTLIELLVVISIISLLSSAVLSSISGARESARDTRRQTDVRSLRDAFVRYSIDNVTYPSGVGADRTEIQDCQGGSAISVSAECSADGVSTGAADCFEDDFVPKYLSNIPRDPSFNSDSKTTGYTVKDTGNGIVVEACNVEGGGEIKSSE